MPDNALCNSSNITSPDILQEEGVREMKLEEKNDGDQREREMVKPAVYPDRPGEPDCLYYLRTGMCRYGRNCRFNHPADPAKVAKSDGELPQRVGQPDCGFYLKTGTCKYGCTCKYHHPRDKRNVAQVALNNLGLPLRQEEKCCPYYMRTFTCKFGVACKFHHPQPSSIPTSMQTTFTIPKPADIGSLGSSILPSTGLAYVGGLPTWLLSKTQYVSDPRDVGAQTYMPFLFSPSQGIMPAQGWNSYMGNLNPTPTSLNLVAPTSIFGNNLVYNANDQSGPGINNPVNSLVANIPLLPQRPDQVDCRYFMSTGSCKYGADCKYHHPIERFKCIDLDGNGEVIVLHSWKPDAVIAEEEQDWNVLSVKERSGWNVLSMLRNKTGTSHLLSVNEYFLMLLAGWLPQFFLVPSSFSFQFFKQSCKVNIILSWID